MKSPSSFLSALAIGVSLTLVVPPDVAAQAAQQRAGQVSRLIPAVKIQRGAQQVTAAPQAPVFWQDVLNTQRLGRARVALDDGSVLNVGSESSLHVTKHDAGAQQTQLELTYGRIRSQAVRIVKPGGAYEVRTPTGVAGVVGTDFYVSFLNGIMQIVVFEGMVKFCNLAAQCVDLAGGMTSVIRGNNQSPDPPAPAPPSLLIEAGTSTDVDQPPVVAAHPLNGWLIFGLILTVALPAIVVPVVKRNKGHQEQTCTGTGCPQTF